MHYRVAEQGRFRLSQPVLRCNSTRNGLPKRRSGEVGPGGIRTTSWPWLPSSGWDCAREPDRRIPACPLNVIGAWNVVLAKLMTSQQSPYSNQGRPGHRAGHTSDVPDAASRDTPHRLAATCRPLDKSSPRLGPTGGPHCPRLPRPTLKPGRQPTADHGGDSDAGAKVN